MSANEFVKMVSQMVANRTGWTVKSAAQTVCNYMEETFIPMKIKDVFVATNMICRDFGF